MPPNPQIQESRSIGPPLRPELLRWLRPFDSTRPALDGRSVVKAPGGGGGSIPEAGEFRTCPAGGCGYTLSPRRGCSSVVERHVANVNVVGSSPITRCSTGPAPDAQGSWSASLADRKPFGLESPAWPTVARSLAPLSEVGPSRGTSVGAALSVLPVVFGACENKGVRKIFLTP